MFEKEAKEWVTVNTGFNPREPLGILAVRTYLAGLEAGNAKLRYCCTCKKWKGCKVVSMYGICADWEIKEIKEK